MSEGGLSFDLKHMLGPDATLCAVGGSTRCTPHVRCCIGMEQQLQRASRRGDYAKVSKLVRMSPELVVASDAFNVPPLMWASFYGHVKVATLLLSAGADPNHIDNRGGSALHAACSAGHHEVFKVLILAGGNPRQQTTFGTTPLIIAARCGHTRIVKALVKMHPAELHHHDKDGYTPLLWAAYTGKAKTIKYLISEGADIRHSALDGLTALDVAFQRRHVAAIRVLMAAKAVRDREAERGQMLVRARAVVDGVAGLADLRLEHQEEENGQWLLHKNATVADRCGYGKQAAGVKRGGSCSMRPVLEIGYRKNGAVEVMRPYVPWLEKAQMRSLRADVVAQVVYLMSDDIFQDLLAYL